jgi:homoserine dehydrogenase
MAGQIAMRIAINGFGNVGQALAQVLHNKAEFLTARYGYAPRVVALATTRGA